jgi:hypothetical protein
MTSVSLQETDHHNNNRGSQSEVPKNIRDSKDTSFSTNENRSLTEFLFFFWTEPVNPINSSKQTPHQSKRETE